MIFEWPVIVIIMLVVAVISLITLRNRRSAQVFLCSTCRFNNDEDCHKVERPNARVCTSYRPSA